MKMIYLLSLFNLIIIQILIYFSFDYKKTLKTKIIFFSVFIFFIVISLLLINTPLILPIFGLSWNIVLPLITSLMIIFNLPIVNDKKTVLFSSTIPFLIDFLTKISITMIMDISFIEVNNTGYYYFSSFIFIINIFFYISIFTIYKLLNNIYKYNDTKISLAIITIFIGLELLSFRIINHNASSELIKGNYNYIIFLNTLLLIIFITTLLLCYLLQKSIKQKYEKINNYQLELLNKNYQDIYIESQEELFKLRHDMANIIQAINAYNNSNIDEIKNNLINKIEANKIYYTNNKIANNILVIKERLAKNNNITINYSIALSNDIFINDSDLISLLSNLLDNAIEAAKHADEKIINLELSNTHDNISLFIDNTYNHNLKIHKKNPQYHGLGLKIIKDIIKKYNGFYDIQNINNKFSFYIKLIKKEGAVKKLS